jgi:hypothetical protein
MINQKYDPDHNLLSYNVKVNANKAREHLQEIFEWGHSKKLSKFIQDLGHDNDYFIVRVPTNELAIEFLLTFG